MKKPLFNKVCIVGVGLIGGSLGMAIKKRRLAKLVIGVVRRRETIAEAFRKKAIDVATLHLKEGMRGADLVILCTPIFTIIRHLKEIAPCLKPGAIVIDVGSSKTKIVDTAKKFLKRNKFVGCHPMAGSEKNGIGFANAALFKNSICFMTSHDSRVSQFWKRLGAQTVFPSSKEHDQWVARSSHLLHLSAFINLILLRKFLGRIQLLTDNNPNPSLKSFGRLAKSNKEIWSDTFFSNQEELLSGISDFRQLLKQFEEAIRAKDKIALKKLIGLANICARPLKTDDSQ